MKLFWMQSQQYLHRWVFLDANYYINNYLKNALKENISIKNIYEEKHYKTYSKMFLLKIFPLKRGKTVQNIIQECFPNDF